MGAYHEQMWGNHQPINKSCGKANEERVPHLQGAFLHRWLLDVGIGYHQEDLLKLMARSSVKMSVEAMSLKCLVSCSSLGKAKI